MEPLMFESKQATGSNTQSRRDFLGRTAIAAAALAFAASGAWSDERKEIDNSGRMNEIR